MAPKPTPKPKPKPKPKVTVKPKSVSTKGGPGTPAKNVSNNARSPISIDKQYNAHKAEIRKYQAEARGFLADRANSGFNNLTPGKFSRNQKIEKKLDKKVAELRKADNVFKKAGFRSGFLK